jgi:hypothetical protein
MVEFIGNFVGIEPVIPHVFQLFSAAIAVEFEFREQGKPSNRGDGTVCQHDVQLCFLYSAVLVGEGEAQLNHADPWEVST